MQDKRVEILQALEQGKITADEAMTMLNQLNQQPQDEPNLFFDTDDEDEDWIDSVFSGVADTIRGVVGDIKDAFSDFDGVGGYDNKVEFTSGNVAQGLAKLVLIGKNAAVSVSAHNEPYAYIMCNYTAKRPEAQMFLQEENGQIQVVYDEKLFRKMEITCYVPRSKIKHFHAATKNAAVRVEDIQADTALLRSTNDVIEASGINCASLVAQTTNAKIRIFGICATSAALKTTNDHIKLERADIVNLQLQTTNASLKLEKFLLGVGAWHGERTIDARTTNSSIAFAVPEEVGLQLNATGAKVNCKIPDMKFTDITKKRVHGTSYNYEFNSTKLKATLHTTNATVGVKNL